MLCTEGFSCLQQKQEAKRKLQGIRDGRLGPSISHLVLANDNIFFVRSDKKSVDALHRTLNIFCDGSGCIINLGKSNIFVSNGCQEGLKEVKNKLGVHNESLQNNYVGMPTHIDWSPIITFRYLFVSRRKYILYPLMRII
jgi:hypothetical protein